MTDDLVKWLGKQYDEDAGRAPQWHDLECEIHARINSGLIAAVAASRMLDEVPGAVCDCGGPARVLREIDAKRELLADLLAEPHASVRPGGATWIYCDADSDPEGSCECGRDERVNRRLRLLARPYAHRPGYLEEWRP